MCPPVFELARQKWKRRLRLVPLPRRKTVPTPQRTSSGEPRAPNPTRRPNACRGLKSTRGRWRRFGSPSASPHARWGQRGPGPPTRPPGPPQTRRRLGRAAPRPRRPGGIDGRRSPESPDGPGPRRQGGQRASAKPRGTTPCTAGRRLLARARSVFSNRLVLTRPRLLPPPGSRAPPSPRSRDRGPQPRAAGGRVQISAPRPLKEGLRRMQGSERRV